MSITGNSNNIFVNDANLKIAGTNKGLLFSDGSIMYTAPPNSDPNNTAYFSNAINAFVITESTANTGFAGNTNPQHAISVAGKVVIDNDGSIGIGTASPSANLHVVGNVYATANINTGTGTSMGIGTSSQSSVLSVVGTNPYSSAPTEEGIHIGQADNGFAVIEMVGEDNKALIDFSRSGQDYFYRLISNEGSRNNLETYGPGGLAMTIDASSNVGIGTTSPSANLHVVGNAHVSSTMSIGSGSGAPAATLIINSAPNENGIEISGNLYPGIGFTETDSGERFSIFVNSSGTGSPNHLGIYSSAVNNQVMAISNVGAVGIGTTSPSANLHVVGNAYVSGNITTSNLLFNTLNSGDYAKIFTRGTEEDDNNDLDHNLVVELGDDGVPADFVIQRNFVGSGITELMRVDGETGDLSISGGFSTYSISATNFIASNKMGIGTYSPSANLHVVGNTILNGTASISDTFIARADSQAGLAIVPSAASYVDLEFVDSSGNGEAGGHAFLRFHSGLIQVYRGGVGGSCNLEIVNNGALIAEAMKGTNPIIHSTTYNNYLQAYSDANNYSDSNNLIIRARGGGENARFDNVNGSLNFGSTTRQMLNLWSTSYAIGVQPSTYYFRTGDHFAWYRGGSHSESELDEGGGTAMMVLNSSGNLGIGTKTPSQKLHVSGANSNLLIENTTTGSNSHCFLGSTTNYDAVLALRSNIAAASTTSDTWAIVNRNDETNLSFFYTQGQSDNSYWPYSGTQAFQIRSSGKTLSPGLELSGTQRGGALHFTGDIAAAQFKIGIIGNYQASIFNTSNSDKFTVRVTDGKVSVNTSNLVNYSKLLVESSASSGNEPYIRSRHLTSGSAGIVFESGLSGTREWFIYYNKTNSENVEFNYGGGTVKGYVSSTGSGQMNFTGQHRTFIDSVSYSEATDYSGLIVCSNKNTYIKMSDGVEYGSNAITINESLPVCTLSNTVNQKSCFGVISDSEDPDSREDKHGNFVSNFEKESGDTRIYINSVGEGAVWVSNIAGNLEAGDYITTSNIPGYGQLQHDDILHNYTVAKITMDCDFNPQLQPIKRIKQVMGNKTYYVVTTKTQISQEEYDNLPEDEREFNYISTITDEVITKEEYDNLPEDERAIKYFKIEITEYDKKPTFTSGWTTIEKQELINYLNSSGELQWEDVPGETEYAYKIRYLDANGIITTEDNAVYKAAFVGCTYHCG